MPEPYAELEIALHAESLLSRKTGIYTAELRFAQPSTDIVRAPVLGPVAFDFAGLLQAEHVPSAYGDLLAGILREPAERRDLFRYARDVSGLAATDLRVRLFIGPSAAELHRLRWELLIDPETGQPLFTDPHRPFSRLLGSSDLRPVHLRPRTQLRALVVVSNPTDLHRYSPDGAEPLEPIDVAGELGAARVGLGDLNPKELASGGTATLDGMLAALRTSPGYDILCLACHGAMRDDKPLLWLEKPDGTADVVAGRDFVQRLAELPQPPRLVVLISCQSAGSGAVELVHAIGPSLATVGIPAVIAMQGNVSMETARTFMRALFESLREDGRVDRAVAIARGAVRGRPDWWMPVLFLRIASGSIWYVPGSGDHEFEKWPALLGSIEDGRALPILGRGMLESMVGDLRDQTRSWAEAHGFPGAPMEEEDLPHVAQFLSVVQADEYLRNTLFVGGLRTRVQDRLARLCGTQGPLGRRVRDATPLDALVRRCGRETRALDASEPHRVLAALPLPIYLTTNPDDLLFDALVEEGKDPQWDFCRWTTRAELPKASIKSSPASRPPRRDLSCITSSATSAIPCRSCSPSMIIWITSWRWRRSPSSSPKWSAPRWPSGRSSSSAFARTIGIFGPSFGSSSISRAARRAVASLTWPPSSSPTTAAWPRPSASANTWRSISGTRTSTSIGGRWSASPPTSPNDTGRRRARTREALSHAEADGRRRRLDIAARPGERPRRCGRSITARSRSPRVGRAVSPYLRAHEGAEPRGPP
ncbi:hypothetical protein A7982_12030 [Minicystis rosea]|nr:hypothetical protein A7982_12030 [Minicystis rosea]